MNGGVGFGVGFGLWKMWMARELQGDECRRHVWAEWTEQMKQGD